MFKSMYVERRLTPKSTRFSLGQNENLTCLSMMHLIFQMTVQIEGFFCCCFLKLDLSSLLIVKCFRVPCASRGWLRRLVAVYPFFKPCGSSCVVCSLDQKTWRWAGKVLVWGGCRVSGSALLCAWPTTLFSVKFVVADPMLRDQMTPAEEINTGWIIWKDRKHLAHQLGLWPSY